MKKILFSLILGSCFCYSLYSEEVKNENNEIPQLKITISEELLALANQVMSQVSSQAQSSLGSMINTAIGSVAHNLLSSAQNAFGDVSFTNNVIIGDQPTDLLTVNANAQFMNNVAIGGNTVLGDAADSKTMVNGTFNNMYMFSKPIAPVVGTPSPLCTLSFQGPAQTAAVRLTLVSTEATFHRMLFVVSDNPGASKQISTGVPALAISFSGAANAITVNGAITTPVTNGMLFVEVFPSANSTILSFA